VFYLGAILLTVVCVLFLWTRESRPNVVMPRQIAAAQKLTGFDGLVCDTSDAIPTFNTFATTMLIRPVCFFFTEPVVFTVSVLSATVFASIYLLTDGLPVTYEEFGYTERQSSLVFLAWVVGLTLTLPLRILDWRILSRHIQRQRIVITEDKITGFVS